MWRKFGSSNDIRILNLDLFFNCKLRFTKFICEHVYETNLTAISLSPQSGKNNMKKNNS